MGFHSYVFTLMLHNKTDEHGGGEERGRPQKQTLNSRAQTEGD